MTLNSRYGSIVGRHDIMALFSADLKLSLPMVQSISTHGSIESEPAATRKLTMDHFYRTAAHNLARTLVQNLKTRRPKPGSIYALGGSRDQNIRFFNMRRLKFWKSPNDVLKRSE